MLRERQNEERQRKLEELKQTVIIITVVCFCLSFCFVVFWHKDSECTMCLHRSLVVGDVFWPCCCRWCDVLIMCVSISEFFRRWPLKNIANSWRKSADVGWRSSDCVTWNAAPRSRSARKPSWKRNANGAKLCCDGARTAACGKKSNDATSADPSPSPLAAPRPGCWSLSTAAQVIGAPDGNNEQVEFLFVS